MSPPRLKKKKTSTNQEAGISITTRSRAMQLPDGVKPHLDDDEAQPRVASILAWQDRD
jgi:hypothetical protein